MRSPKSRPYRMTRRAESVDQTRQRITEAAARLHTSVGPAHTTVASIADEAGVTRLTVYRHFADLDVLFEACRAHWRAQHPPPDARRWPAIDDLGVRARQALGELYAWYGEHAEELLPIYRDITTMPPSSQDRMRAENRRLGDLLIGEDAPSGHAGRQLRAVARHLVDYRTWHSLAIQQELGDRDAVDVAVRLITSLAPTASRKRRRGTLPPIA